jgi:hypothetical protein
MRRILPLVLAGAVLALAGPPLLAAFKKIPLAELIASSDEILLVEVVDRVQVLDCMEGVDEPLPFQRLTCRVIERFKGDHETGPLVVVHIPGGTLPGGGSFLLSSAPAPEELENGPTVVFLNHSSRYAPPLARGLDAGHHGVYSVRRKAGTVVLQAKPGSCVERALPLEELRTEIRRVEAARARKGENR